LDKNNNFILEKIFPNWTNRGNPIFPDSDFCIRCQPKEDKTIGFFIACFIRKDIGVEKKDQKVIKSKKRKRSVINNVDKENNEPPEKKTKIKYTHR